MSAVAVCVSYEKPTQMVPPAVVAHVFNERNNGVATKAFVRRGFGFYEGQVPSSQIVTVTRAGTQVAACQGDEVVTWPDGSLKFVVLSFRDIDFTVPEQFRTYKVEALNGSWDRTCAFTLSTITGGSSVTGEMSSHTQPNKGTPDTANHVWNLNTALATAENVTITTKGPACFGGYVKEVKNSEIIGTHYFYAWNDGSDTLNGNLEFAIKLGLTYWSYADKDRHDYTFTLKENAVTKETYSTIQHHYHAEWIAVRMADDQGHADAHWQNDANRPVLIHEPDKAAWVASGLVPPWDTTLNPTLVSYADTYAPLSGVGQKKDIDGTGGSPSRGIMTCFDAMYFMRQDGNVNRGGDWRKMKANALAGLSVGYHFSSDQTRTRANKAADDYNDFSAEGSAVANTNIALILGPKAPATYDFTADGMPAAQHAYKGGGTPASKQGGWVGYSGGNGGWSSNGGSSFPTASSHGCSYSHGAYLWTGNRWYLDCDMDLAMNICHQVVNWGQGGSPNYLMYNLADYRTAWGIPATTYDGQGSIYSWNDRSIGWWLCLYAHGFGLVPDNDVAKNFCDTMLSHCAEYFANSISYYSQGAKNLGVVVLYDGPYPGQSSPWTHAFMAMGAWTFYNYSKIANMKSFADHVTKGIITLWDNHPGSINTYRFQHKPTNDIYTESQPFDDPADRGWGQLEVSGDGSTTISMINAGAAERWAGLHPSVDEKISFNETSYDSLPGVPSGIVEGQKYWIKSVDKVANTFTISATQGGAAISIAAGSWGVAVYGNSEAKAVSVAGSGNHVAHLSDNIANFIIQACVLAHRGGNTDVTQAKADALIAYRANVSADHANGITWAARDT